MADHKPSHLTVEYKNNCGDVPLTYVYEASADLTYDSRVLSKFQNLLEEDGVRYDSDETPVSHITVNYNNGRTGDTFSRLYPLSTDRGYDMDVLERLLACADKLGLRLVDPGQSVLAESIGRARDRSDHDGDVMTKPLGPSRKRTGPALA